MKRILLATAAVLAATVAWLIVTPFGGPPIHHVGNAKPPLPASGLRQPDPADILTVRIYQPGKTTTYQCANYTCIDTATAASAAGSNPSDHYER